MEVISEICHIGLFFSIIGGGAWILGKPRAVKRIGKRRLYVKWNKK